MSKTIRYVHSDFSGDLPSEVGGTPIKWMEVVEKPHLPFLEEVKLEYIKSKGEEGSSLEELAFYLYNNKFISITGDTLH